VGFDAYSPGIDSWEDLFFLQNVLPERALMKILKGPWALLTGSRALRQAQENPSLDTVDHRLINFYRQQVTWDHAGDQYTPELDSQFENVPGLGRVSIGVLLGRGANSLVYSIQNYPDLVIKYQSNCYTVDEIHPLIKDFFFGSLAHQEGLSMNRIYLSPPTYLPQHVSVKKSFQGGEDYLDMCRTARGTVRYMIMNKIDNCLNVIGPDRLGSVRLSMKVGMLLMDLLERLQRKVKIGHGDVHPGNVCVVSSEDEKPKLILIDFELAFFIKPQSNQQGPGIVHAGLSPWEIAGFTTTARDDVFNAIFAAADVMYDGSPWKYAKQLADADKAEALVDWKFNADFFNYPKDQLVQDHTLTKPNQKQSIRAHIANILLQARQLGDPNGYIDYKWFINEFTGALEWAIL